MKKSNTYEELFEGYEGENPHKGEIDWGEDVGRERIWSMADEAYEKEYGQDKKDK